MIPMAANSWLRLAHLWIGLSAGLFLVLIGITGSLLVFQSELDQVLNPSLFQPETSDQRLLTPEDARRLMEAEAPSDQFVTFLRLPGRSGQVYQGYYGSSERLFHTFVTVDPYQREVMGSRAVDDGIMRFVHMLHFRLHLGRSGQNLVGTIGLLSLVLFMAGAAMLWQRRGGQTLMRRWHPRLALYSLPVLALVVISGVLLALPQYTRPAVEQLSPLGGLDLSLESTLIDSSEDIGLSTALNRSSEVMPEARPVSVGLPRGEKGIYRVSLAAPEETWQWRGSAHVVIDRYSGEVLSQRHWSQRSGGDHFMAWLRPLHGGSAFGLVGKILYALIGLLPLFLYITGVRIWLRRRGQKP